MQIFAGKEFTNPIQIIEAFDNESFIEAFSQIEILRKRPDTYLLGYIRYEAKEVFLGRQIKSEYPLLYFEMYKKKSVVLVEKLKSLTVEKFNFKNCSTVQLFDYSTYKTSIERIKTEIADGNTYQINYTYDWEVQTELDGFDLYQSILPRQTTPYNAYIKNKYEEIISFSPELFFELSKSSGGDKIRTKPMKGTIKRGKTKQEDKKNIEFLKNDIKNRAENVMIVDLLRNDLGKIAKTGTVKVEKLFEVETHETVHQMTSEISAKLEENTTLFEIFDALFPCGSVTGAPKINTMEIIDRIEKGKREVYCGAIGLISPEKTVFSVPIRILQKQFRHCEEGQSPDVANSYTSNFKCRVGGAIVWDSTAEEEWEETLTKIKFLTTNVKVGWASADFGKSERSETRPCKENHIFPSCRESKTAHQGKDFSLIETMLVKDGEILYEKEHLQRMEKSAKELGFKFSKQQMANSKWQKNYILRLLLNKNGELEVQELPLDEIKTNIVTISDAPIDSTNPLLYHKTDFRPWYEKAMEKIKNGEIFDEIFFNEKGELTEGARSNIVLQINGKLFTPPVECGLLNGILRQELVNGKWKMENGKLSLQGLNQNDLCSCGHSNDYHSLAANRLLGEPASRRREGIGEADDGSKSLISGEGNNNEKIKKSSIQEKILYLQDLQKAEKVFCLNSVRGIVEVSIDKNPKRF